MADLQLQLIEQKRKVDFNTYDMTLKELVSMVGDGLIDISPEYQRQFRWEETRQSLLIESLFLGIPVPSLFMATNSDGTWEVIDGVQRLSSIINFISSPDDQIRRKINRVGALRLVGLNKLTEFEGKTFSELPMSLQIELRLKPLKVITLSDKSDMMVRFDLFERLNTGGVRLTDQEIRNCIFKGEFINIIKRLSQSEDFKRCVKFSESKQGDGTLEEAVLRFFAYLYDRDSFQHGVKEFLNVFTCKSVHDFNYTEAESIFRRTFAKLSHLDNGITKSRNSNTTSMVLFEAVSVGAAEAILSGVEEINIDDYYDWVRDPVFNKLITGATNSRVRVLDRVSYCMQKFRGNNV